MLVFAKILGIASTICFIAAINYEAKPLKMSWLRQQSIPKKGHIWRLLTQNFKSIFNVFLGLKKKNEFLMINEIIKNDFKS